MDKVDRKTRAVVIITYDSTLPLNFVEKETIAVVIALKQLLKQHLAKELSGKVYTLKFNDSD